VESGPLDTLHAIPRVNRAITLTKREGGALVTLPLRRPRWAAWLGWLLPVAKERRVELDSTGAWVLALCDGERTVENVIDRVMQRHHLSFQEARASVLQFMRMLTERGVIALVYERSKSEAQRTARQGDGATGRRGETA